MEVSNLRCRNCKFYRVDADLQGRECACKRIDHKEIKFAVPWFKSYDCDFGTICSDFLPNENYPAICREWEEVGGFDGFWPLWVDQWLPYANTNKLVYFTLGNDTSVRYGVKLLDYVYGEMVSKGVLKAVEKEYYKKRRVSEEFPTGYELVHEAIEGVTVKEGGDELSAEIFIEAEDVWDYAQENLEMLKESRRIVASNTAYGVDIVISVEDDDTPYLCVEVDDEEECGKYLCDRVQANKVARSYYDDYLTSDFYETMGIEITSTADEDVDEDVTEDEEEELDEFRLNEIAINEREDELDMAVQDFVELVMEGDVSTYVELDDEVLQDLKEHFLEYMYRKHGVNIYRPMYLYDAGGIQRFTEFPYENMIFEDNPMYR